jgi:hypothetical protein
MPFEQCIPRPFTPNGVRMFAPVAPGVYGISNAREWIYIGAADDIQGALLAHMRAPDHPVRRLLATGFVYEVGDRGSWPARQDRLIREYEPVCSRRATTRG